jgi:hypothetical protein
MTYKLPNFDNDLGILQGELIGLRMKITRQLFTHNDSETWDRVDSQLSALYDMLEAETQKVANYLDQVPRHTVDETYQGEHQEDLYPDLEH